MPNSQQLANEFNEKNIYEIDYDYLKSRIEKVMNRTARRDLDQELKKTVKKLILEEAIDYESFRRKNIYSAVNGKFDGEYTEKVVHISNEIDFFLGYVKIANECVKELNPAYLPPFMFGLTQNEVQNIFKKQFESYTRRDEARHDLLNVGSLRSWKEDVEFSRAGYDGKVREYEKEAEREKGYIKETYIRKEIVKQELKDMGFWRRWFSDSRRARELKAFVKAAEKVLKDVKFTKEGEKEAIADFKAPAARHDDVKLTDKAVGTYYERKEPESIKNSFFEIGYRPNRNKFNDHVKASKAIKELLDKDELPNDVKDVVKMNFKKLGALNDVLKGRSNVNNQEMEQQFSNMERAMVEKYNDYVPLTMDDFKPASEPDLGKEPVKERVEINLGEKTNTIVEPVKANEKTLAKEETLAK